jgi:hypothetical protein
MTFNFTSAAVAVRPSITEAFRDEWEQLGSAGASFTGSQRVAIAAAARAARAGAPAIGQLNPKIEEVARRVGAEPATIRRPWVRTVVDGDIGEARYVEIVGVVSRLSAIDTFCHALGMRLEPLPEPSPEAPTGEIDPEATPGKGYVSMVGGTSIVGGLSLVPAEMDAQEDLHGPLYLTYEQMAETDFKRGLHRTQMELIAARTSAVNECFY